MSRPEIYWIEPGSRADNFPPTHAALTQPDGLLCFGGDLSPARLLCAYQRGIFPWYSEGQPIIWWSPSPRCVIYPHELNVSRSLKKNMRNTDYHFSMDHAFDDVIVACAHPRGEEAGSWITSDMRDAYIQLYEMGYAHSAEIWKDGRLVGGLYGIAIGRIFFGESMFCRQRDASKIALACMTRHLIRHTFHLIDAQVTSAHIMSLGAREIGRATFLSLLDSYCRMEHRIDVWHTGPEPVREYYFSNE